MNDLSLCGSTTCRWESVEPKLLVVTGAEQTPMEICNGSVRERPDLRTTNEEADAIIIHQVIYLDNSGTTSICVISDDTYVFVYLLNYYNMMHVDDWY